MEDKIKARVRDLVGNKGIFLVEIDYNDVKVEELEVNPEIANQSEIDGLNDRIYELEDEKYTLENEKYDLQRKIDELEVRIRR